MKKYLRIAITVRVIIPVVELTKFFTHFSGCWVADGFSVGAIVVISIGAKVE
jgi:hypothetical protein